MKSAFDLIQFFGAARNGTVTFLCLFLIVVVLHGTIELVNLEPQSKTSTSSATTSTLVGGAWSPTASSKKPNLKPSPITSPTTMPLLTSPRSSSMMNPKRNPTRTNPTLSAPKSLNKPRVLLSTGSSPKPYKNPVEDHYLLKAIKNKIDYCRLHGIEVFYNMALRWQGFG